MPALKGFDASHYQTVNWNAVRGNVDFAICKVSEATSVDPTWQANKAGALANGIPLGGYHFVRFNTSAAASASVARDAYGWKPGMLPLTKDAEDPGAAGSGAGPAMHNWLHAFDATYGLPGMIYTGAWWWVRMGSSYCAQEAGQPLWLSGYAASIGVIPAPWKTAAIWQFTDAAQVPGVGSVDGDTLVSVSVPQLVSYASGGTPSAPATPTGGTDMGATRSDILRIMRDEVEPIIRSNAGRAAGPFVLVGNGNKRPAVHYDGFQVRGVGDDEWTKLNALAKVNGATIKYVDVTVYDSLIGPIVAQQARRAQA